MTLSLRLDMYGDVQLSRTLERFSEHAQDARPAWDALADDFADIERRQFDSEGGYASGGWSALSPRYAAWKAARRPGAPILVFDGHLRESLTSRPFGVEVITPARMVLGTDVDYGEFHQLGTPKMPRRRPVELREADRRRWVRLLHRWVVSGEVGL